MSDKGDYVLKDFYFLFKMQVVEHVLYCSVFLDNTLASLSRSSEQKRWEKFLSKKTINSKNTKEVRFSLV